jgi:anti-sigma-K factor RskA
MILDESVKKAPCPELESDLVLFHYGELHEEEQQRVRAHLKDCAACTQSLKELAALLPQTILADEPPSAFWNDYSRELRYKLAQFEEPESWWRRLFVSFKPWGIPALAASAVVALALTFGLGKNLWQQGETALPEDGAMLEVLPIAENLDFYRNLEVLDNLEILQQMNEPDAV